MKRMAALLVLAAALAGCSQPPQELPESPKPMQFTATGRVVSVDAGNRTVSILPESPSGKQAGRAVTLVVESAALLEGITSGDTVEYTIQQKQRGLMVVAVTRVSSP